MSTESNRVIIRRQYAFSCMLQCYFCGSNLSRRTWHSSSKYSKVIWQCVKSAKKGRYLKKELDGKDTLSDRINNFRNTLKNNQILEEFDRHVFESIIEKVIIDGIDKDGNKDSYMITFIYKTGLEHEIEDAKKTVTKE